MQEIFNDHLLLEKYPGKGGWIYAIIENLPKQPKITKGNWVTLNGSIDGVELNSVKLWPMAGGRVFLPVKAEIRKKIGKAEGDSVHIILFGEKEMTLPNLEDFEEALQYETLAHKFYSKLNDNQKKIVADYIFSKADMQSQIEQMANALKLLAKGILPK